MIYLRLFRHIMNFQDKFMEITTIKSNSLSESSFILKPNYHMNLGKRRINKAKNEGLLFEQLGTLTKEIFSCPIFVRMFVNNSEKGLPYITAMHMMTTNPLDVAKNISKKYTLKQKEMSLEENQILISCAGTVGNVKLITKDLQGVIGSQDIIRVNVDDIKIPCGYLYAYLASNTANSYIQSFVYGSVVSRIEAKALAKLPIPILSEETHLFIHNLIMDVSKLRIDANNLLREAIELFESKISENAVPMGLQYGTISYKNIDHFHKRLDGQFQLGWNKLEGEKSKKFEYIKLSNLTVKIFVGGRGKRNYVEKGVPFLSSSDMMLFNPKRNAKKVGVKTKGLEEMKVDKNDILISRSGTVGNTVIVGDDLEDTAISEHAIRLVIDPQKISAHYVFAYLRTNSGRRSMEASSFGSVIITLNEDLIGNIELPILDESLQKIITDNVKGYVSHLDKATLLENEAIDLIEKEIDQWQQ